MGSTRHAFLALVLFRLAISAQAPTGGPAKTLAAFYRWYLNALNENRDPIRDEREQLRQFVAPSLMAELDRLRKKPGGLDTDYFLQTQDFLPDWKSNFTVGNPVANGAATALPVTFGLKGRETYRVKVTMANAGGGWRMVKVEVVSR